jgi:hypothetical protein
MTKDPINILLVDAQPAKLLTYEAILQDLGENLIKAGSARDQSRVRQRGTRAASQAGHRYCSQRRFYRITIEGAKNVQEVVRELTPAIGRLAWG